MAESGGQKENAPNRGGRASFWVSMALERCGRQRVIICVRASGLSALYFPALAKPSDIVRGYRVSGEEGSPLQAQATYHTNHHIHIPQDISSRTDT